MWEKWKSCAGLVKMYISAATVETSMEDLQKIKILHMRSKRTLCLMSSRKKKVNKMLPVTFQAYE